jgi:Ca-activated chloride channel family protein
MTQTPQIESVIGRFVIPGKIDSALPLRKTTIHAQVMGLLASVSIKQQFSNPISFPVELDYLFPLPEKAAIVDFELRIGNRLVKAEIQELEQARQAFEQASQKGQRAGLLEQRRPNLFAIRLTNLLPGEMVEAALRYQDRLKFADGTFELVFPMGLTPRYHTADHPEEELQTHAPVALPGEEIGPVEIQLSVDAGAAVRDPESPSHTLAITRLDERRFQVGLAGPTLPDHDFVMRYALKDPDPAACAWVSPDPSGDYLLAELYPPALPEEYQPSQREFVFVLDRSGSMRGEPIAQARNALRACLRSLNPGDTFQILLFDDQLEWFRPEPSSITQEEINQADRFLAEVEGRGGTEILQALDAIFNRAPTGTQTRLIVFLTDGAISAEERALQQIRKRIGKGRLFTFGIGPSVNRSVLNQMARIGRGTAEFLQLDEDIEGAIIRFQDRVSFPILTDLSISWKGGRGWDVYPAQLPDLYAGQPLELCGRVQLQKDPAVLSVKGERDGKPVEFKLEIHPGRAREDAIQRVWSRARIDELLDQLESSPDQSARLRAEIISTALAARLVTPFTAFVGIDQETALKEPGTRKIIHVAHPLPKGLDRTGFIPMAQRGLPLPTAPSSFTNLDIPQFLRRSSMHSIKDVGGSVNFESGEPPAKPTPGYAQPLESFEPEKMNRPGEAGLRWLARTQQVDGSWNGDVETTAAALLAFVRHGDTTAAGSFRQLVRRAYDWLLQHGASGLPGYVRALALCELSRATRLLGHTAAASAAADALLAPEDEVEKAIVSRLHENSKFSYRLPEEINSLDQLRLAGTLNLEIKLAKDLLQEQQADLKRAWMAVLK